MKTRLVFSIAWILFLSASFAPAQTTRPAVSAVVRIGMTVEDMDRSVDFYTHVLSFQKTSDIEVAGEAYEKLSGIFGMRARIVNLRLGDETLELTEYLTPRGRRVPRDSRSNDRWFQHIAIVTMDMDKAYAHLRANKVRYASTGPQTLPQWNKNAAGIRAFYFRDPDDHVLEVIWFPAGKGDPKWQNSKALFAGIDHTAIVVLNTERSLALYRDLLGMKVAGGSENYGTEQEHLNNVEGAHLRITSLRAEKGPGIEFLEYVSPKDGRPAPLDAKSNDLFHWQTTMANRDPAALLGALHERGFKSVSSTLIRTTNDVDSLQSVLVSDADGHIILLTGH